ncbi:MAG TPA: tipN, partial [Brevundimonas sp.]|nr:tipN [Brevundimonas sp.]
MKSRPRPPLNLTDSEPALEDEAPVVAPDVQADAVAPEPMPEHPPMPESAPVPERPMSERQRRRLAEQQAIAEQRAAEAEKAARTLAILGESADAPPATVESTPLTVPASPRAKSAKSGANHAYLIAGLASALWVGGLASWFAYELGSGMMELDPLRLAVYGLILLAPVGLSILL